MILRWNKSGYGKSGGVKSPHFEHREMWGPRQKEQMQIYKFKDLTAERTHSHFLQIVLQNSIWCASPDSLNDEDEFRFSLDYEPSQRTHTLLSQVVAQYRTTDFCAPHISAALALANDRLRVIVPPIIDNTIEQCRTSGGITSFSATKADRRLWEEYGGKGNGVRVEIDIPDHLVGHAYHRVHYVREKIFHVDSFLESALFPDRIFETYRNILLTKTKKWAEEDQVRFIGNRQNVNLILDGWISEVTFGPNVPPAILSKLSA